MFYYISFSSLHGIYKMLGWYAKYMRCYNLTWKLSYAIIKNYWSCDYFPHFKTVISGDRFLQSRHFSFKLSTFLIETAPSNWIEDPIHLSLQKNAQKIKKRVNYLKASSFKTHCVQSANKCIYKYLFTNLVGFQLDQR